MTRTQLDLGARQLARTGQRWPGRSVAAAWRRHQDLLRNVSTLVATTGVTSVLGFAYWAVAARLFDQRAVGYGSAAVSAMTLIGTIGMLGMGTVLIGELPRRRHRAGLVSAALITSGFGSLIIALAFTVAAPHLSARFGYVSGTLAQGALFVSGVALTAVTLVFDQATIGLLRGGLQLSRNAVFAAGKLLVLPAAAIILHDQFGTGILFAWVAGTALSLIPVALRLRFTGATILPRPDWAVLRGLGSNALAHNWLNLSITVPLTLIPVLVTLIVSPTAGAAFYAAWTLSGFLKIVPTHLSTVLFALAAADPQLIARKLRFTLRLSLLIGLPGMIVLGLGAHAALGMFGAGYARAATVPLELLVISYIPSIPKTHYMAVCRATGRIPRAAAILTAAAVMEVTAVAAGGAAGGLKGLSLALLAVYLLEGLVTTPPVLRAAFGHGRHRQAHAPAPATRDDGRPYGRYPGSYPPGQLPGPYPPDLAAHGPAAMRGAAMPAARSGPSTGAAADPELDYARERQEAGIAILISIARGQTADPAAMSRQQIETYLPDP